MKKKAKRKAPTTADKPLTDVEIEELVYLFRVIRAGNERPAEVEKYQKLKQRWNTHHANELTRLD